MGKSVDELLLEFERLPDQEDRFSNLIQTVTSVLLLLSSLLSMFVFPIAFGLGTFIILLAINGCFLWKRRLLLRGFLEHCKRRDPERIRLFTRRNPLACSRSFLSKEFMFIIEDTLSSDSVLSLESERQIVNLCFNRFFRDEFRESGPFLKLTGVETERVLELLARRPITDRTRAALNSEWMRLKGSKLYEQLTRIESQVQSSET